LIVTVTMNPAVDETFTVHELLLGETNRIKSTDIDPGGKGLNVGRVVKRLGRPAMVITLIGGSTGEFIRQRLDQEGVDTDLVYIDGPTRVNISILDESTGVQTNLNHEGPEISFTDLHTVEGKIREWLPEAVVMVFGGSLLPGAPKDTYARLIRWVTESEVRSILDASGTALVEGIKAGPYLIKPNLREMQELLGRKLETDDEIIDGAQELLGRGIDTVVASMGSRGAIAVDSSGAWKAVPPEVATESTLGAGDSMVAGLAIGISEHTPLPDSLALGTAAATATVITPGTELCRVEDVQRLLPRVKVERLR